MSSLKPCPTLWCNTEDHPYTWQGSDDKYCVICPGCQVEGPYQYDEADAIDDWNDRTVTEDKVERVARIISPGHWQVMDSYLAEMKRKYRGQNIAYDPDQFKDSASMHIARAALAAALGGGNE